MSQLQEFLQLAKQDTELQKKVANVQSSPAQVVELGRSKGYSFTLAEIEEYMEQQGELEEEKLDAVAGGRFVLQPTSKTTL